MQNKIKGAYGEDLAQKYLEGAGYKILERNLRIRTGEIDIICEKDGCIVFVEVKYRKSLVYGYPREAVTYAKQKKILKTALYYISSKQLKNADYRFDIIEILDDGVMKIEHIENAFQ